MWGGDVSVGGEVGGAPVDLEMMDGQELGEVGFLLSFLIILGSAQFQSFLKKPFSSLLAFPKKNPLLSGCAAGGGFLLLLLVPSSSIAKELEVARMMGGPGEQRAALKILCFLLEPV